VGESSEEIAKGMAYANVKPALAAWRAAHPRATMREIEDAVEEQVARLRAEFLAEVVQQSHADEEAHCERCGSKLATRGRRKRRLRANGDEPIVLERSYAVCPVCQVGVFPPRS
jgi:DNA-directed RNA polymerase subunit RPC12/RpoP